MPKKNASTLRGIGKMGPAKLHEELKRYEDIRDHMNSKYAHMPAMGEKHMYTKDQVKSAIKQLEAKIDAKKGGTRRRQRGGNKDKKHHVPSHEDHKDEAHDEEIFRENNEGRGLPPALLKTHVPGQHKARTVRYGVKGIRTLRDLKENPSAGRRTRSTRRR